MNSNFWLRPAVLVLLWMVIAAYTLSELATLPPSLAAAGEGQPAVAAIRPAALRARGPALSRRTAQP